MRRSGTHPSSLYLVVRASALVRADDVRVPLDLHGDHRLGYPLVRPEQRADDSDLRMGTTELVVADVLDHQSVGTGQGAGAAEHALLPRVQARPFRHAGLESPRVDVEPVGPA